MVLPSSDSVEVRTLHLHLDRRFAGGGDALRLAITGALPDRSELHGHDESTGGVLYRLPPVRFLVRRGLPVLIGLGSGRTVLEEIFRTPPPSVRCGDRSYAVLGVELEDVVESLGAALEPIQYRFVTPWLALNQENHARYQFAQAREREELLSRILVGNTLAGAKGVGYFVELRLQARTRLRPVRARLKNLEMIGFLGRMEINFAYPRWWGLGKSVALGFGILERVYSHDPHAV